jgi:sugar/nucleoside kinase (ribokinase family)
MQAAVFGNATLDVICRTVDEVPRYESIAFEHVAIAPGGCGSNVAIGLQASGIPTGLIARVGNDDAAFLVKRYWERLGIDLTFVRSVPDRPTGTSIGLIDSNAQPRFIHTSGANATLTAEALNPTELINAGIQAVHIGGFFVLPGLLDGRLPEALGGVRQRSIFISLDVVRSPRMKDPTLLWPCMQFLDVFLCNAEEAHRLTGCENAAEAAQVLLQLGSRYVIVKLGADGCWLEGGEVSANIRGEKVDAVDTTGAGDAFAAGLIAAVLRGADMAAACQAANTAGAKMVSKMGAIAGWFS